LRGDRAGAQRAARSEARALRREPDPPRAAPRAHRARPPGAGRRARRRRARGLRLRPLRGRRHPARGNAALPDSHPRAARRARALHAATGGGMKNLTAALALLAALAVAPSAHAETLDEIFARATAAYFRGDYDEAARDYRRLLAAGVIDADVSYNLGAT